MGLEWLRWQNFTLKILINHEKDSLNYLKKISYILWILFRDCDISSTKSDSFFIFFGTK